MGAPIDQFLCIPHGGPQVNFSTCYMGTPSDQFLRRLSEGPPQISYFAY